ncbi:hypothetical protein [Streptomyces sp. NPDC000878]
MTDIENRDMKRPDTQKPDPDTQKSDPDTRKPDLRGEKPDTDRAGTAGTDRTGTDRTDIRTAGTGRTDTGRTPTERTATGTPDPRAEKPAGAPAVPPPPSAAPAPARAHEARPSSDRSSQASHAMALLPQDERDKLTLRLQHAVTGFVDGPQDSVEEADRVLAEVTERFTEAVERTRRTVRGSWQSTGGADTGDTEKLRLALRNYRELAERMLSS